MKVICMGSTMLLDDEAERFMIVAHDDEARAASFDVAKASALTQQQAFEMVVEHLTLDYKIRLRNAIAEYQKSHP